MRFALLVSLPFAVLSPLRAGERTLPDPPKQNDPWTPLKCDLPAGYLRAAKLLFPHGLADPRGCEYRAVKVVVPNKSESEPTTRETHAWLLPARKDEPRFGICWNGLIYPVAAVGAMADLGADVREAIRRHKEKEAAQPGSDPRDREIVPVDHRGLGSCGLLLLLRMGEGKQADEFWRATRGDVKEMQPTDDEILMQQVEMFAWGLFECGLLAHKHGEDGVALYSFRRLDRLRKGLEKEGVKLERPKHKDAFAYLQELPRFLSDQERRATAPPLDSVVCWGPGRHPDQGKRISSLIRRLDEVMSAGDGLFGVDLYRDPIVDALVNEGEPAILPLLECFEKDARLTRSAIWYYLEDGPGGDIRNCSCSTVREVAQVALTAILRLGHGRLADRDEASRKNLGNTLRAFTEARPRRSVVEHWFAVLNDDRAGEKAWGRAADVLTSDVGDRPFADVHRLFNVVPWTTEERPTAFVGEALRSRKDPTFTSMLLKRLGQTRDPGAVEVLTRALAAWDLKAAVPSLRKLSRNPSGDDNPALFLELIEARTRGGDRTALDEYAAWVATVEPGKLKAPLELTFRPLLVHRHHPAIVKAARTLFADPASPWRQVCMDDAADATDNVLSLLAPLMGVEAFRSLVLDLLARKEIAGTVEFEPENRVLRWSERPGSMTANGGHFDPELEGRAVKTEFRVRDLIAFKIGERIDAAPRCELYWPLARRDAAVAACVRFLKTYGERLEQNDLRLPALDRPATAADVAAGRAIFTLDEPRDRVRRVSVKLPLDAVWLTLKDRPTEKEVVDTITGKVKTERSYRQTGKVLQAEEVLRDGRWVRYYGFAGVNRLARVPAEEIELRDEEHPWVRLGQLDGRAEVAGKRIDPDQEGDPRLPGDGPVSFRLVLRNRSGLDVTPPPADKLPRLRLSYAPEIVSSKGRLVPNVRAGWSPVKERPGGQKLPDFPRRTLAPAEQLAGTVFDLREGFVIDRPGFYRVILEPPGETGPGERVELRFSIAPRSP